MQMTATARVLPGLTLTELRDLDLAHVPVPLVRAVALARGCLRCTCGHLRVSHGHADELGQWLGLGLGDCLGHPYIGRCDRACRRFTLLSTEGTPRCTRHDEQMGRRAKVTLEEQWCGTWWDCPLDTCACVIVVPTDELTAFLAGHEGITPGKGTR
ncbi:hypothetical protein JNW90_24225 [Micromonospora sp. STR1s_5]|nr:hypothetical protein [Micromonospora sp. STR1s_5]